MKAINIIFDGPPSHESGRFVEVEKDNGESVGIGEWSEIDNGMWKLRITVIDILNVVELITCAKDATP